MRQGRKVSMFSGGLPPACAQASKYALSHARGLNRFISSVCMIVNSMAANMPLQTAPLP
jgi:hypothetical protein